MITLQIPEPTPSLNEFTTGHWSRYRSMRKHWSLLVMVAKNHASIGAWPPFAKSKVTIVREGVKLLDDDNLKGGCKPIIDSLRDHRLIVDDSPAHLELVVTQVQIRKPFYPRTTIQIECA